MVRKTIAEHIILGAERVTDFKGILEQKTERAALLLRKLLGKIRLDPVTSLKGRPFYHATSTLDALVLIEHKTQEPGPPVKGSPGPGRSGGGRCWKVVEPPLRSPSKWTWWRGGTTSNT